MLHGTLDINGVPVAAWHAQRTTEVQDTNATHTYDCEVAWTNRKSVRFNIDHVYSDGATVLAAKVMSRAARLEWELQ